MVDWCSNNNLIPNINKNVVNFHKNQGALLSLIITDQEVEREDHLKVLGATISSYQRLVFSRQLRKFGVSKSAMIPFYGVITESALTFSITVRYGSSTAYKTKLLGRVVRTASKIIGCKLTTLFGLYHIWIQWKRF